MKFDNVNIIPNIVFCAHTFYYFLSLINTKRWRLVSEIRRRTWPKIAFMAMPSHTYSTLRATLKHMWVNRIPLKSRLNGLHFLLQAMWVYLFLMSTRWASKVVTSCENSAKLGAVWVHRYSRSSILISTEGHKQLPINDQWSSNCVPILHDFRDAATQMRKIAFGA